MPADPPDNQAVDDRLGAVYALLIEADAAGALNETIAWNAIREAYMRGYTDGLRRDEA